MKCLFVVSKSPPGALTNEFPLFRSGLKRIRELQASVKLIIWPSHPSFRLYIIPQSHKKAALISRIGNNRNSVQSVKPVKQKTEVKAEGYRSKRRPVLSCSRHYFRYNCGKSAGSIFDSPTEQSDCILSGKSLHEV